MQFKEKRELYVSPNGEGIDNPKRPIRPWKCRAAPAKSIAPARLRARLCLAAARSAAKAAAAIWQEGP